MSIFDKIQVYDLDKFTTIEQLKDIIDDKEFIPTNLQTLLCSSKILHTGTIEDNNIEECSVITLTFSLMGGTRYKKSSSQMRWKWRKKRMRRLQRQRRRMRNRAK
tara:strand:+ start:7203 stop:7517 length:315 start_codon:yes stop_codon:yes gene_type:complete